MMRFALGLCIGLVASSTSAAVLDFSGNICDSGKACEDGGSAIDQGAGSIAGQLDVIFDNDVFSVQPDDRLQHWGPNYSDLIGVAFSNVDGATARAEIFLRPFSGFEVTLSSFKLGGWYGDKTTQVSVLDGFGRTLFASNAGITISGQTASLFSGPWVSPNGIRIQWGPDAYEVGIDVITFGVRQIGPTTPPPPPSDPLAPVPLPMPAALLLTGLLGFAGLAIRRRN